MMLTNYRRTEPTSRGLQLHSAHFHPSTSNYMEVFFVTGPNSLPLFRHAMTGRPGLPAPIQEVTR